VEAEAKIQSLFSNPVFLSALFSLLVTQFMKALINIFRKPSVPFKDIMLTFFWKTGGMPSSHSALAISLATAIGIRSGVSTDLFVLSLVFALVVIRDALGVRRAAGQQARAINLMGRELAERHALSFRPVKEIHGHKPAEVIVGGVMGFFIALAFCTL
jgi:hypothetical protein